LSGTGWEYEVGDCLGVFPHNSRDDVLSWMDSAKLDHEQILDFVPEQGNKPLCRSPMSAGQYFQECADIFGRPSRRFYEFLSINAKDEKEKAEIKHLMSKDGQQELKDMANKQ
jgi:sulfite reductase alpha subunit-like flavoprotein